MRFRDKSPYRWHGEAALTHLEVGKIPHGIEIVQGRAVVQLVQHHHLSVARDNSDCSSCKSFCRQLTTCKGDTHTY